MGETTYLIEVEIKVPIVLKTDSGDYVRRELTVYIIDAERVNFIFRRETIKDWRISLDFEEDKLEFKGKEKNVNLIESKGGHLLAQLEVVGTWKNKDAIYLVDNEDDVSSDKAIWKIHKILNHKSKEQMHYVFRNAGKLNEETRKKIDEVVDKCEICKKNGASK